MLRIETQCDGRVTILRLCGRIQAAQVEGILAEIDARRTRIILDLDQLTLVDVEAVRFLSDREKAGVELLHCPPYVREWILRERAEAA